MSGRPRALRSTDIRAALGLAPGDADREYAGVSTDSRTIGRGELFVALRGDRHDGADHLEEVAARGAGGAIVPAGRDLPEVDLELFAVADPLAALGALAAAVRREGGARVIGVTGSSGKTTVKEMIALAVGEGYRVFRTEGNLNSQVGLPLSILRAPADAEVWVLELGASAPGEIRRLTEIAAPDDAVVTTVGPAHLEAFGDEERVLAEKLDLVRGADPAGRVVVGELPARLPEAARDLRPNTIVAGLGEGASYRPDRWRVGPDRVAFERGGVSASVGVGGEHHLRDALIAAAVAEAVGVPLERAASGLSAYEPIGMRGAVRQLGALTLLADCYNANPESFRAAIAQCRDLYPGRRLAAFVGSMLELGDRGPAAHRQIAELLVDAGFEVVAASGAFAAAYPARANGTGFLAAEDPAELVEAFAAALRGDEVVLVKASRGARLERVIEALETKFGSAG